MFARGELILIQRVIITVDRIILIPSTNGKLFLDTHSSCEFKEAAEVKL